MKRLLFVSHAFPPSLLPESLLVLRTVRALEKRGWAITVLTAAFDGDYSDSSLIAHVPASVKVIRLPSWERFMSGRSFLPSALRRALLTCGLPEINMAWLPPVALAMRRILENGQFDVVHSWASPHASNIAGLVIKRSARLPWVVHLSDPWIDNPYSVLTGLRRLSVRMLERLVIRDADAIVFVTEQAATTVMKKYPAAWTSRAHVIPHGFDSEMSSGVLRKDPGVPNRRMRLVYVGSFYAGLRTPENLLRAIRAIADGAPDATNIELSLIGPSAPDYRSMVSDLKLDGIVSCGGPVSFDDSVRAMAAADVLIVLDAPAANGAAQSLFLPSKVVDYLMLKKPILGITPLEGPSADVIRAIGCPVVDPADVAGIAEAIRGLAAQWEARTLGLSEASSQVAEGYDIHRTTASLEHVLQNA